MHRLAAVRLGAKLAGPDYVAQTGELVQDLQGHSQGVSAIAVLPDGSGYVSGGMDKSIIFWVRAAGGVNGEPSLTCLSSRRMPTELSSTYGNRHRCAYSISQSHQTAPNSSSSQSSTGKSAPSTLQAYLSCKTPASHRLRFRQAAR